MRTLAGRGALAVLVAAAVAGCGGKPPLPTDVAYYQPYERGGMEAVLTGTLVRQHGCTYVEDHTGQRWVPMFPDVGLAWHDEDLHAGGQTYRLGTEVALPGGQTQPYPRSLPRGCDAAARTWLVAWDGTTASPHVIEQPR
ncbi:hypothetical protein [Georgenia ruanii]|uniref:hypothetical protein n=1 Tax=Georgenia ruanii TaxID=348442 RepID=UPI00126586CE|nr:hypothetical protein [Georgenia ruanii]